MSAAKHSAGIRTAWLIACTLLGIVPMYSAPAAAKAATQRSPHPAKAVRKRHHQSTGAASVVKKASEKASLHTAVARKKHTSRKRGYSRVRGQQKIDSTRALAIQQALIREHYLNGTASGAWNQASEEAMRRYQSDHGWQSKTVPDSRALISLGLGPSNHNLLNPDSAIVAGPNTPRGTSLSPVSQSADPGAASQPPAAQPAQPSSPGQSVSDPQ